MDIAEQYERSYQNLFIRDPQDLLEETLRLSKGQTLWAQEMKDKFLPDIPWHKMRVLEVGGGMGGVSLNLARLGANCTVVDLSAKALTLANRHAQSMGVEIKTFKMDVTSPENPLTHKYDLILDSHLLHCLTDHPSRISYLQFVKDQLERGGIFIGESMVYKKKLFIPSGYRFDETEKILFQKYNEWLPFRKIADSIELEEEFKFCRLNILFFYYYSHFVFQPSSDFTEIPSELLPASVRFVLNT
jgi:SAM-dependent methyltransferase